MGGAVGSVLGPLIQGCSFYSCGMACCVLVFSMLSFSAVLQALALVSLEHMAV